MSRFIQLPMRDGLLWVDPRRIVAIIPQDPRAKPVTSWLHVEGSTVAFVVNLTPEEIEAKIERAWQLDRDSLLGKPIG